MHDPYVVFPQFRWRSRLSLKTDGKNGVWKGVKKKIIDSPVLFHLKTPISTVLVNLQLPPVPKVKVNARQ